jgi:excisionase family DNA binding protein
MMKVATGMFEFGWDDERKPFYTVDEIANIIGKSCFTVRVWCKQGHIMADRIQRGESSRFRISDEELRRYLANGLRPRDEPPED